ncbi:MAG TPA: PAS domain S-box protein [Desulfuromonadaceae bacterium]
MINKGQLNTILIRIIAAYSLATGLWFCSTDLFEFALIHDLTLMRQASAIKGLLFAVVSSTLLYFMLNRFVARFIRSSSQLRDSESRYSTLIENARDGIFIQTEGRFAYLNTSACAIFAAQSPDELLGTQVMERYHPDYRDKVLERIRIINEERRPVSTTDEVCLRMDGTFFDVDLQAVPFNFNGINGALVFFRDISERKQAEKELQDSEARYRAMIDAFDGLVYICSQDYRIEYMNQRFKERTGYDGTGKLCYEVLHKLDSVCPWCVNDQVFAGNNVRWEMQSPKDRRWYDVSNTPIYNGNGTISKQAMITDITDHKQLEEQLLQTQKMDSIGTLASGVAHDFNNILTVIMGSCTLLMMKAKSDPELEPFAQQILDSSERAAKLTHSLLAFSRKQNIRLSSADMNSIVLTVKELLERIIGEDITLEAVLSPIPLPVSVDRGQLEQVLMNLAANSRDAMPQGGLLRIETSLVDSTRIPVAFEGLKRGMYAQIMVSDTGSGMDKATQSRVFDPFFTTKTIGHGTGLGLSMAYGIISQHEGGINVNSAPGIGTIVFIHLPIRLTSQDEVELLNDKKLEISAGNETILLVEDDDGVREVNGHILTKAGYTVLPATNGDEALQIFKNNMDQIALIVLDVIMPGMNGKELHDHLKLIRPEVKVLFASGYSAEHLYKKGVIQEEVNLLMKPFSSHVLLGRVRELIDSQLA